MTELAGQFYAERTYEPGFDQTVQFPTVLDGMPHELLPGLRVSYYDRGNANSQSLRLKIVDQLQSLQPFVYAGVQLPRPEFRPFGADIAAMTALHTTVLERLILPDKGPGRVSQLFVEAVTSDEIEPSYYRKIVNEDLRHALDIHGGVALTEACLIYSGIHTQGVRSKPCATLAVIRAIRMEANEKSDARISVRYSTGKLAVEAISESFLSEKTRLQQREARATHKTDRGLSVQIRAGNHAKRRKS